MALHSVGTQGLDLSRGRSQSIFGKFNQLAYDEGRLSAIHYRFEPGRTGFKLSSNVNAAEAYWSNGHNLFGSDGAAVAALAVQGGGITIGSDGDNEGASIRHPVPLFKIARTTKLFGFEARFLTSTVADTKHGIFCGLMDSTAVTATVPIAAAGTLADVNLVGFHRLEGDGDQLDTVYKADGVTQVSVQTDAISTTANVHTAAGALAADTFIKVGMLYVPSGDKDGSYRLSFYINGVRLATSKQIPSADGTDFPNDVLMSPVFAVLNATGSTPGTASLSRIEAFQLL